MMPSVKCPGCLGEDIEPREEQWWCNTCQKFFDTAAASLPTPAPKKGRKK